MNQISAELVAPVPSSPGVPTPPATEVDTDDALVESGTDKWGKASPRQCEVRCFIKVLRFLLRQKQ